MLEDPEFDSNFYESQIELMIKRYQIYFKSWKIDWNDFYSHIRTKLRNKQYWIWIFLCGFEQFLQKESNIKENRYENIYKDANQRIYRIIGDSFITEDYVKNL